jgi:hypothetical protein
VLTRFEIRWPTGRIRFYSEIRRSDGRRNPSSDRSDRTVERMKLRASPERRLTAIHTVMSAFIGQVKFIPNKGYEAFVSCRASSKVSQAHR